MKLKSLLIGSAALMAAATGAKAADPIVIPEPEAMEYVRVCDVYGAGFFYIPGTETCLKISGMVRYQMDYSDGDFSGDFGFDEPDLDEDISLWRGDGWRKYGRAEINLDARSETEYGTLGAFIKLRGTSGSSGPLSATGVNDGGYLSRGVTSSGMGLQQAIISLGGLSMGMSDSIFDTGLDGEQDRGFAPVSRVHFMGYTFAPGNGVTVSVMLEEADRDYDWTPNVVGRLGVSQGWGSADLYAAYDATAEEFALKGIVKANLSDRFKIQALAQYESGISFYSVNPFGDIISGLPLNLGAEWSAAAMLGYKISPKLSASIGGTYFSNVGHGLIGDIDAYNIGTTIDYTIVQDFNATLAINYTKFDTAGGDLDQWHGFLRLQRNF